MYTVSDLRKGLTFTLDGEPLADTEILGGDFPGGVCLLVAEIPGGLKVHGYHVAG